MSSVMDPYRVLKILQDSGQFDKLRAEIFSRPSIQEQFEAVQQRLITELSSSPLLLDVPLKMRQARLPQIFNSFRLAVRKTSIANDIHSMLWTEIHEMVPQICSAIESATSQPRLEIQSPVCPQQPSWQQNHTEDESAFLQADTEQAGTLPAESDKPESIPTTSNVAVDIKPDQNVDDNMVLSGAERQNAVDNKANSDVERQDVDSECKQQVKSSKSNKRGRLIRLDSKIVKEMSRSTSDDEYVPALKKSSNSSFTSPQEPISKRVEIWWPLDKCWYKGIVTAYRSRDKKHHIRYDDNEIEWLDLTTERWRYE